MPSVEGTIEATNERGLRIDGEWWNVSRFRPIDVPPVGTLVRLEVDPKGFIRELDMLDSKLSEPRKTAGLDRDDRTARLAVLQAAAAFLGQMARTHDEVRSEHVLVLADKWLAWVNQ